MKTQTRIEAIAGNNPLPTLLAYLSSTKLDSEYSKEVNPDSVARDIVRLIIASDQRDESVDIGKQLFGNKCCPKCGYINMHHVCQICGGFDDGMPTQQEIDKAAEFIEKYIP